MALPMPSRQQLVTFFKARGYTDAQLQPINDHALRGRWRRFSETGDGSGGSPANPGMDPKQNDLPVIAAELQGYGLTVAPDCPLPFDLLGQIHQLVKNGLEKKKDAAAAMAASESHARGGASPDKTAATPFSERRPVGGGMSPTRRAALLGATPLGKKVLAAERRPAR